jgi:hypothetical protein
MQTDALGPLLRLEVTAHGIGDHRVQFRKRISLRSDAATARGVPARHVTAGFRTRLHLENDFTNRAHAGTLRAWQFGVNEAKRNSLNDAKPNLPQRRKLRWIEDGGLRLDAAWLQELYPKCLWNDRRFATPHPVSHCCFDFVAVIAV